MKRIYGGPVCGPFHTTKEVTAELMIYLDNAATTPIDPRVIDAMLPYLRFEYGNPGSIHTMGCHARAAIDKARQQVAEFFSADPSQIIFTSGGTESNNFALRCMRSVGTFEYDARDYAITSEMEHDSVFNVMSRREVVHHIQLAKPDSTGRITYDSFRDAVNRRGCDPSFVSLMYMNNETGAVSDIDAISEWCLEHGIPIHVDCVQAAGFLDLNARRIPFDFASVSSHKIHGPKGVGCLFVREPSRISPLIIGGDEQEYGLRGGTENVAGIVGFGEACRIAKEALSYRASYCAGLAKGFMGIVKAVLEARGAGSLVESIQINGPSDPNKILNLRVPGIDAETLVLMLDCHGVCISAGSACHAHENHPSRALVATGLKANEARESVRISFGSQNTPAEINEAAEHFAHCIWMLKSA